MAQIPLSTYRLQLRPDFGFAEAAALLEYLDALGITDVYTSPVLAAFPGSLHGYDTVDHTRLNPELGISSEFERFSDQLRERRMGWLLDVVPNHMRVATPANAWWTDVLENGPSSAYSTYFDIDWDPPDADLAGKVLLPILSDQYGRVLEAGELRVAYQDGALRLRYHDSVLPLAPKSWTHVLDAAVAGLKSTFRDTLPAIASLESILTALRYLPPRHETDPDRRHERQREKEVIKARLGALVDESEPVRDAILAAVDEMNGRPGSPESFDRLDALLRDQAYRVAYWRVASDEINYRRFFDINELAAIRVEDPRVFRAVHDVVLSLVQARAVTGLRIDHVDGLFDPHGYLVSLQEACGPDSEDATAQVPMPIGNDELPCYLVVEKILADGECLPSEWPVHGTTGYDFLNIVGGLFVDPAGARKLIAFYEGLAGHSRQFSDVAYECKKLILRHAMSSQMAMLARRLHRISEQHRHSRDFTAQDLAAVLREVVACLSVYRTYLRPGGDVLSAEDRRRIEEAVAEAQRRNSAFSASLFDFVRSVLLLEHPKGLGSREEDDRRDFALRLQQLTGAAMAKAIEDTAFYRFYPLASRGEVGGSPDRPGVGVDEFHRHNEQQRRAHPHTLLATSTHDTKRGEDVRVRIRTLSEIPDEWARTFKRFRRLNQRYRVVLAGSEAPDINEEYLLYQTLVGTWPFESMDGDARDRFVNRIQSYMCKALREAKVHTSWVSPNESWEGAVALFVDNILQPRTDNVFLREFTAFQRPIARAAVYASLVQTLLKITSPGVPDFYQGTELWDLNLVDPDNRRPVDFSARRRMLNSLRNAGPSCPAEIVSRLDSPDDGCIKMFVTHRALALRRVYRDLFTRGQYVALEVQGERADHVVAFARLLDHQAIIVVAGRLLWKLGAADAPPVGERAWDRTCVLLPDAMPQGTYRDAFTAEHVSVRHNCLPVAEVLAHLPIALLERIS